MAHRRSGKQKAEVAGKQAIFVLGMHRSGTSALAGVLAALGVTMPQTMMTAHPTNPKGFFESYAVMNLSDEMLRAAGGAWDDWRTIDLRLLSPQEYDPRISEVFHHEFGGNPALIAVKDPRHCRMAPLWLGAFEKLGYKPLIILPYRHPLEVAQSLASRDGMPVAQGLLIWLRHVLDAEIFTRGLPRIFVYMPDLLADWRACIDAIATRLDITWPLSPDAKAEEIGHFLDRDLKNHTIPPEILKADPMTCGWVLKTFAAMQALDADPNCTEVLANLDDIRSEFDLVSELFGPALAGLEKRNRTLEQNISVLVAENDRMRTEVEPLHNEHSRVFAEMAVLRERARLAEHHAEGLRARIDARDQDVLNLKASVVKIEEHRRVLDEEGIALRHEVAASKQTITEKEHTLAALGADLAAARQTIAEKEHTLAARSADLAAARQTITEKEHTLAALSADLAAARQTITEKEHTLAALNADLAAARQTIAEKEHTLAARSADLAAARKAITEKDLALASQSANLATEVETRNRLAINLKKAIVAHDEAVRTLTEDLKAAHAQLQATEARLQRYREANAIQHVKWAVGGARP